MKEHKPAEDAWSEPNRAQQPDTVQTTEKQPETNLVKPSDGNGGSLLEQLYRTLHTFGGTEELILLLVLLIVASDGLCPEALILAILLISGGKT